MSLEHLTNEELTEYYTQYKRLIDLGSRNEGSKIKGYDLKFGYHVVRLMLQCEIVLLEGTLDLTRHREVYKSIRRGEWSKQKIQDFFGQKEADLETAYHDTKLPYKPDEEALKSLLLECLEMHYHSLPVKVQTDAEKTLATIAQVLKEKGYL